jgi:flagellar hook-associated protein 3 FlgL
MRISTSQIFDSGARGISRNQVDLYKLQNQLSTGRKVLTPEDDPIASAQALVLTQSKEVSAQFLKNQSDAQGKLSIVESQVGSVGDLLQNVRERLVQAGSTTLTNSDRSYIAQELEARFSELMGIANAQDGSGNYLFSGYQGAVKPFSTTASGIAYQGDDGKRLLQVDASRQMATNVSGKELFESIRNGNGSFVTSAATTGAGAPVNTGSGVIDEGSVTDPAKWSAALASYPGGVQIQFSVVGGITSYQLFDSPAGTTAYTAPQTYTPGQSIKLERTTAPPSDFGASLVISGQPANNDVFTVTPSTNQSVFTTLRNAINTLTSGIGGAYTSTEYSNRLAEGLTDIDQALENVNKVRSTVGSNLKELDSLTSSGEDMQLQYASSLSALQDLDYTQAITEMSKKQVQLEAAQLSFKQISQLSLFSIL